MNNGRDAQCFTGSNLYNMKHSENHTERATIKINTTYLSPSPFDALFELFKTYTCKQRLSVREVKEFKTLRGRVAMGASTKPHNAMMSSFLNINS